MNNTTHIEQSDKPAAQPEDRAKTHRGLLKDLIRDNQDDPDFLESIKDHLPEGTTLESLRDEED